MLIGKWRGVAQDAAEEVFGGARERVARMGGMKGYKERIRDRAVEEREGWFGTGGNGSDEEGEGDTGNAVKLEEKKEEEDGTEEEEEEVCSFISLGVARLIDSRNSRWRPC